MTDIRVAAYAKVTLALHVTGVREDGYHELDGIVVSVSAPADVVSMEYAAQDELVVTGPATVSVPLDHTNLATRALALLRDSAIDVPPVRVTVEKHIPPGAGLGGGSADAAAVLWAARAAFGLDLDDAELASFGAELGSDVPVCVIGGMTHMSGRGEHVERLAYPGPFGVVLVTPPFSVPTPAVYRAWDDLGGPISMRLVTPTANGPALRNDLEPAAEHVEPRLIGVRETITAISGQEPLLAGSGSSYALCCRDREAAERVAEDLRNGAPELQVFAGVVTTQGIDRL